MSKDEPSDPWNFLRATTQARIGLGRVGSALPTARWLELQTAHALAREAVLRPWDWPVLGQTLTAEGSAWIVAPSQARDRATFLRRPDAGRKLADESQQQIAEARSAQDVDLALVVSDGLSAKAIDTQFLPFWRIFRSTIGGLTQTPIVLCPFGRVAISDQVGEAMGAKLAIIFVGERPGLSASDSMGIYLTFAPKKSNHDAMRNCISNIRSPHGLSHEVAAHQLGFLIRESLRLRLSGVGLKQDAPAVINGSSRLGVSE